MQDDDQDELQKLRAKCERLEGDIKHITTSLDAGTLPYWQRKHDELLMKWFKCEAQCAEMRSALEWVQTFQGLFSGNQNTLKLTLENALSTSCGKSILARLEEARRLLEDITDWTVVCDPNWILRRDQWLKGGQP